MLRRQLIWVVLVAFGSVVCWQVAQSAPQNDEDAELYRIFVDAVEHIDRSYVKDVSRRQLIESAINGMLNNLDPYSNYIPRDEWKQFNRQTVGKFGGIGIQISTRDGYWTVISPLVGTPAYEAGILAGDRILEVNDEKVGELTLSQVVDRLTGPPGSQVSMQLLHRPYTGEPFKVTLTRAIINVESVLGDRHRDDGSWDYFIDNDSKIVYVRISSFIQGTKDDLEKVIQSTLKEGMRGLVLDLRYNPGGLLSSAIEVADLFIKEGKIVSTTGRNTVEREYVAEREPTFSDFPMVVLVNQYSASASEIVAACLQDHQRALVIGERTWGKGSVQNVIELEGGDTALKLTTASYQRPNGHNIHRFKDSTEKDEWGVKPNDGMTVPFTSDQHISFSQWRARRDQVRGKAEAVKAADEAANKTLDKGEPNDSKDQAKPEVKSEPKPDQKPLEKPEEKKSKVDEGKDGDAKEDESKEADPAELSRLERMAVDPSRPFDDPQLAKAIEYLKEKLKGG